MVIHKGQAGINSAAEKARLTEELAHRILGWKSAPDRFLKAGRGWLPKWRFAPFERLEDAFRLLDSADTYVLTKADSSFAAEVWVGSCTGRALGELKATTITLALAKAIGLYPSDEAVPSFLPRDPRLKGGERTR